MAVIRWHLDAQIIVPMPMQSWRKSQVLQFKLQLVSSNRYLNAKTQTGLMSMKIQTKGHSAGQTQDRSQGLRDSRLLLAKSKSRTTCLLWQEKMVVFLTKEPNLESSAFQPDISHMEDLAVLKEAKTSRIWLTFHPHKLQLKIRLVRRLKLAEEDSVLAKRILQLLQWQIVTNRWMNYLERQIRTRGLILAKTIGRLRSLQILPSREASGTLMMSTPRAFRLQIAQVPNHRIVVLMSLNLQDLPAMKLALTPVIGHQNANIVSDLKNDSSKTNQPRNQKLVSTTRGLQSTCCSKKDQVSKLQLRNE